MLFAGTILPALGQRVVFDISCVETLIANHKVQQEALKSIKENEAGISALQQKISEKMVQIEYFHSKFYNSLKTVDAIIKNGKDIIYCTDIAKDIGEYQAQMVKIAVGDPELVTVAYKTEAELISRSVDVMIYINEIALKSGEKNLMDNKQRLELCMHVVNELRAMRALAYSVCRQMKTAKRNGVLQTLMPGEFRYIKNSKKHVEDILSNLKFK